MRIKFLPYCFVHKILLSLLFVDVQQRCLPWSELAAQTNVNWEKAVEDKQRCEKTDSYGLQKQKHAIHTCLCACLVCTLTEHWLYCIPGDTTWGWGSWVIPGGGAARWVPCWGAAHGPGVHLVALLLGRDHSAIWPVSTAGLLSEAL